MNEYMFLYNQILWLLAYYSFYCMIGFGVNMLYTHMQMYAES